MSFVKKSVGKEENEYENSSKHKGQFLIVKKTQKSSVKSTKVKIMKEQSSTEYEYPNESLPSWSKERGQVRKK